MAAFFHIISGASTTHHYRHGTGSREEKNEASVGSPSTAVHSE